MKNVNIMVVGVGGQGTLLTSRIIGKTALNNGYDVKLSEVHGMAQRGGGKVCGAVWDRGMAYLRRFRGETAVFRYAERAYAEGAPGNLFLASVDHGTDRRRCGIADRAGTSESTPQIKYGKDR